MIPSAKPGEDKNPLETRRLLLEAAAREIHMHGFQAASLSRILSETGVTKGALYYHFPSKLDLGYAVVDEYFGPTLHLAWIEPLQQPDTDPVQALIEVIRKTGNRMTIAELSLGCPVNNLALEMSPVDAGFRERLEQLLDEWRAAIAQALERGRDFGSVSPSVDVDSAAAFIVASLEGCVGMAKNAQSRKLLVACGKGLIDYLQSLRSRG